MYGNCIFLAFYFKIKIWKNKDERHENNWLKIFPFLTELKIN